jgi:nitrite reductase (cytochrome c-552)
VVALIQDLKAAREAGRPDAELATARALQRRAQFMMDFIEAEDSSGFHAPQEAARILAQSIDLARQGQLSVRDPNFKPRLPGASPSLSSAGGALPHSGAAPSTELDK